MMYIVRSCFLLFLFPYAIQLISCECRKSFMTICDSFEDLVNNRDAETWTELVIGSDKSTANESVHLMKMLDLTKFPKLTALLVIQKIGHLETTYAFQCSYELQHLNLLSFYGNEMEQIEEYYFPDLGVTKFSLVNNKIKAIKGEAFRHHSMEIFDLSDNLLEIIETKSLPQEDIKTLIIKNNKLNFIERESLASTLQSLHLDYNELRHLNTEIIGGLTLLREFTLSHNKFKELPNISHMKKLILFDISSNTINSVDQAVFKELNNLKLVDLSHNNIAHIQILNVLIGPSKQPSLQISLAFNDLREMNLTNVSFRKEQFVFYGNPWDCHTWDQLQPKLIAHQSKCDKEHFSSGTKPYCINFKSEQFLFDRYWDEHIKRFRETIIEAEKNSDCNLVLERSKVIDPVHAECVA